MIPTRNNKSPSLAGWLLILLIPVFIPELSAQYISGFGEAIRGETIRYESHQPDASQALLVRSLNQEKYIEWDTDPLPTDFSKDTAEFLMIAGIDVNAEDNHGFVMDIGGHSSFTFRNPVDTMTKNWRLEGDAGISLRMKGMMIDKYGDLFGYLFLSVPASVIPDGEPIRIRVTGESAESRSWFMVFKYNASNRVQFIQEQAIKQDSTGDKQLIRIDVLHFDKPAEIHITLDTLTESFSLSTGFNLFRIPYPAVKEPVSVHADVTINETRISSQNLTLRPVRRKTVYLLPHSHHDIGYTHVQEEVESIQRQNIRDAVRYSMETRDYPEGSRFKWNSEVSWSVENFLETCEKEEKEALFQAIKQGAFEVNGLYANILTGLCRPEEMFRMMDAAQSISQETGIPVQSAMISDIPGNPWSLVSVLAQSGIRYFSVGTNTFHRIGTMLDTWGDRPFYWESASGNENILCWVHGKGYSEFHTGLAYTKLQNKLKEQLIFDYLNELEEKGYPYDLLTLRYNIGSDNGPPDPYLSGIVRRWNETYVSPKIVIATVTEAFREFESRYGNELPTYRGDLTGYWEDGAASTAHYTSMNRKAGERLTQTTNLFALYKPEAYPEKTFDLAWKNVLLFSEHTWGSWNSISDPFNPFTFQQWNTKKSFAATADSLSRYLLNSALTKGGAGDENIWVYNTNAWPATGVVTLPDSESGPRLRIVDEEGTEVPFQVLSNGERVFLAENVPSYGNKKYYIIPNKETQDATTSESTDPVSSILSRVTVDPVSGAISSLKTRGRLSELSHPAAFSGINEYLYVEGRNPENSRGVDSVSVGIKDNGPVLTTLVIASDAPGCTGLIREITLYVGMDRIDVRNVLYKEEIIEPEAVHFAFPFRIPNGNVRIGNAWGHYLVEQEQLPGSNKNYLPVARWVDVSNDTSGITFIPLDAPMIEHGAIRCDATEYGWVDSLPPTGTILSYVMNNYWETNYKAGQAGRVEFRYVLFPHGSFSPEEAERKAISCTQPLIVTSGNIELSEDSPTLGTMLPINVINEQIKPVGDEGFLLRMYNPSFEPAIVSFQGSPEERTLYFCDPWGLDRKPAPDSFSMDARDVKHIFINKPIEKSTH